MARGVGGNTRPSAAHRAVIYLLRAGGFPEALAPVTNAFQHLGQELSPLRYVSH